MSAAEQLIEDVIFWEKHTEIQDSLEMTLRQKYIVISVDPKEKDGIRAVIAFFITANMDSVDNYRTLKDELDKQFSIIYK
jgi:hypothetical protein